MGPPGALHGAQRLMGTWAVPVPVSKLPRLAEASRAAKRLCVILVTGLRRRVAIPDRGELPGVCPAQAFRERARMGELGSRCLARIAGHGSGHGSRRTGMRGSI